MTQMALYADVHSPTLYESSESIEGCVNSSCSDVNSTAPARLHETNTPRPDLLSSTAATDTVPAASATPSITAATDSMNSTDAKASASTVRRDDLGNVLPSTPLAVVRQHNAVTGTSTWRRNRFSFTLCYRNWNPPWCLYSLHSGGQVLRSVQRTWWM